MTFLSGFVVPRISPITSVTRWAAAAGLAGRVRDDLGRRGERRPGAGRRPRRLHAVERRQAARVRGTLPAAGERRRPRPPEPPLQPAPAPRWHAESGARRRVGSRQAAVVWARRAHAVL